MERANGAGGLSTRWYACLCSGRGVGTDHLTRMMGDFLGRSSSASASSSGYCSRILARIPRWTDDLVRLLPTMSSAGTNL